MTTRTRRVLLVSCGIITAVTLACGREVTPPPPPPPDLSGNLIVHLATPNANDRAVQLTMTCDVLPASIAAMSGYDVYSDLGAYPIPIIAIRKGGASITSTADILTMAVSDTTKRCAATLQIVASQGYSVRLAPFTGYSVVVAPQAQ